ncbi:unnamed protein product, partial [Brachionus calyciflorus]
MENSPIERKYKSALKKFSNFFKSAKQHEKYKFGYPICNSGLTRHEAKSLGFNFTTYMWKKSGRKSLQDFFIEAVEKHMQSLSSIAANRYLKKYQTNAFYSSVSFLQAYSSFEMKDQISFSSFYKYLGDKYKKPHRLSDLCDYCELNQIYKKEVVEYACQNGINEIDNSNFESILCNLSNLAENEELNEFRKLIKDIEYLDFHKSIAKRQREAYNLMKNTLAEDYILIEIDWKQKILLGLSPRQTNSEFWNQKTRTLLGFGIYYRLNDEIKVMNIDLVSSFQENESAFDVVCGFRKLDEFKAIEQKKYIIWADTGSHFRCAELIHYLFNELAREQIRVCLNFFCEKHGKNGRDQHFSLVSNFIKQESFVKRLACSKDVVDAINKHQAISNEHRKKLKLKPIYTRAFVLERENLNSSLRFFRKIKNIRLYYNFYNDSTFNLKSTILSDLRESKDISFNDRSETSENDRENMIEESIKNNFSLSNFSKKMENLKKLLNNSNITPNENNTQNDFEEVDEIEENVEIESCTQKCRECKKPVKFQIITLLNKKNQIRLQDIQLELFEHQHA